MVATFWRNRRGTSTRGCLISLLVLVIVLYYGINLGEPWYRYVQIRDEMNSQARLAPSLTNGVIRRRLRAKADDLGLPEEARDFRVRRSAETRRITITTEYQETVDLPFITHTFNFTPSAEAPL